MKRAIAMAMLALLIISACECGEQHTWETDDDFCSYGERETDG